MGVQNIIKKKSKIVRTRKGKKRNMYFNEATTAAIIGYQKSNCLQEKEKLYNSEIKPAFEKLAENLIIIHSFQGLHASYEELKSDCVAFLYETIEKYDAARGSLPFSYFNVVAKNWLIIRSKKRAQKLKRNISLDDRETMGKREAELIENFAVLPSQDEQVEAVEFVMGIHKILEKIKDSISNTNEKVCIDAVIHIFKNVDNIDILKKRAVFLYIRNITGLSPKQLTTTIASLKRKYRELRDSETYGIY